MNNLAEVASGELPIVPGQAHGEEAVRTDRSWRQRITAWRSHRSTAQKYQRKRRLERSSWRQVADTRIWRLRSMAAVEMAQQRHGATVDLEQARLLLDKAEHTLKNQSESLSTWWNGSLRDQVWRVLHQAETIIVSQLPDDQLQKRTAEIAYDARLILDPDDPILREARAATGACPDRAALEASERARRIFAGELVRRYREAWDDRYTRSRSFRNRLIVLIGVVTFAVAVLVTAGSLGMIWLEVRQNPPHATWSPQRDHLLAMLAIAVLGAVGGLLSGSGEVVKVGGVYNPFSLPWYLLFFKIPMGALTGILGVLAIKGDLVPDMKITMNNWSQIIVWALIFGASQQLITFMVDRRVKALTTSTPQEQVVNK